MTHLDVHTGGSEATCKVQVPVAQGAGGTGVQV